MEVKVNATVIANHRKPIGMVGAKLGGKIFQPEAFEAWPEFAKAQQEVERQNNLPFILNRSPRVYKVTDIDILGTQLNTDATGETKLFLNPGTEKEMAIPIQDGMEKIGVVTENAMAKALSGDKSIIFADAAAIKQKINQYNQAEYDKLETIINKCKSMQQRIKSAMDKNEKLCDGYLDDMVKSAPTGVSVCVNNATGTIQVTPTTTEEEI